MDNSKKSTISIIFAVFTIVGLIFAYQSFRDINIAKDEAVSFDLLSPESCEKNLHVKGEVYACLGAYGEEYTTRNGIKSSSSTYYYIIAVGDANYITFATSNSVLCDKLDALTNATFDYLEGKTDYINYEPFEIDCKVTSLKSKMRGYMLEYLVDGASDRASMESQLDTTFLADYKIAVIGSVDNLQNTLYIGLGISGLFGLLLIISIITSVISKKKTKSYYPSYPADVNSTPDTQNPINMDADRYSPDSAKYNSDSTPYVDSTNHQSPDDNIKETVSETKMPSLSFNLPQNDEDNNNNAD